MVAFEAQLGLDKVRIKKGDLITKLQQNLEKHKKEFEEAHEAWKKEVIEEMEKNLSAARDGEEIILHINLAEPNDHSDDYKHVISLLKASIDDIVVIMAQEFRQYHDDIWRWSDDHAESFSNYTRKGRKG